MTQVLLSNWWRGCCAAIIGMATFVYMPVAQAQQADASDAQEEIEQIVVTGSHIPRAADSPSPLSIIGAEEIADAGRGNMGEFLALSTFNTGAFMFNDSISQALSSASNIDLRGLGARATLVLINGRRQVNNPTPNREGNVFPDVNALAPTIAVERIEILKDGGSAIYGTDAVAGVANFITRNNFNGFEMTGEWRKNLQGSADEYDIAGIWGGGDDRTHVMAAIEFHHQEAIFTTDVVGLDRVLEFGSASAFGNPGTFLVDLDGEGGPSLTRDPLCGSPLLGDTAETQGLPSGPFCRLVNGVARAIIPDEDRLNGMAAFSHQISDKIKFSGEFTFSRIRTDRKGGTFPIVRNQPTVPADNPGNLVENGGFGVPAVLQFLRLIPSGTPESLLLDSDVWRTVSELEGRFSDSSDWRWNTSLVYARNDGHNARRDVRTDRLELALNGFGGGSCGVSLRDLDAGTGLPAPGVGDCLFFNPFANSNLASPGDATFNVEDVRNDVLAEAEQNLESELTVIEVSFTGSLFEVPGGMIGAAIGFQWRDEFLKNDFDPISNTGGFTFLAQGFDFEGKRDVYSIFHEVIIPIVDGVEIQVAGRWEDYGNGVTSYDPKVAILWQAMPNLTVRGSWGTAFRAPGLAQLFSDQVATDAAQVINDITGLPELQAPIKKTTGNPLLNPEESRAFTAGFDWEILEGLTIGLDYWNFEFTDLIVEERAQTLFDRFGFCDMTDPTCPFIWEVDASGARRLLRVNKTLVNASSQETDGIDMRVNWLVDTDSAGLFTFNAQATWVNSFDTQIFANEPVIKGVGTRNASTFASPVPEWRANFSLAWQYGPHRVFTVLRYIDGLFDDRTGIDFQDNSSFTTIDLNYTWSGSMVGDTNTVIRIGLNNVFDEEPPITANDFFTFEQRVYDPRGRTFTFAITQSF